MSNTPKLIVESEEYLIFETYISGLKDGEWSVSMNAKGELTWLILGKKYGQKIHDADWKNVEASYSGAVITTVVPKFSQSIAVQRHNIHLDPITGGPYVMEKIKLGVVFNDKVIWVSPKYVHIDHAKCLTLTNETDRDMSGILR